MESALIAIDIPVMVAATLLCLPVFITGRQVRRLEGAFMMTAYLGYLAYLILARG